MPWDGKFTGTMEDRADKPYYRTRIKPEYYSQFEASSVRRGGHALDMAYHHITDWQMLRGVWNKLIDDKHFGTICCWLYAAGFDTDNNYYVTDQPQTPAGITRAIMNGEDVGKVGDPDQIHERITWSPWNLVEGPLPNIRSDDEGNFHDVFSNTPGISDGERADLKAADQVYVIMAALNLAAPIPKDRALALSKAFLGVNRKAQVIHYRPEMWDHHVNHGDTKCSSKCWRKATRL